MLCHQRLWNRLKSKLAKNKLQPECPNFKFLSKRLFLFGPGVMIHYPPRTQGCQILNKLAHKQSVLSNEINNARGNGRLT